MDKKQRYREKHIKLGLCIYCPRPSAYPKRTCQYHLDKYRKTAEETKRSREARKAQGRCPRCGTPKEDKQICCANCRDRSVKNAITGANIAARP